MGDVAPELIKASGVFLFKAKKPWTGLFNPVYGFFAFNGDFYGEAGRTYGKMAYSRSKDC